MLQRRARYGKSGLEVKQLWDACESTILEAKDLDEQVTYGSEII